jgi:hypothetical protein
MGKKIVYIVLGSLFIFGLLFLIWSWLFSGTTPGKPTGGQFGSASNTNQTSGTNLGTSGNGQTPLGQAGNGQTSVNGSIPLGGSGGGTGINGNNNGTTNGGTNGGSIGSTSGKTTFSNGTPGIAGVTWLGGSAGSGVTVTGGGNTNGFTPISINGVNGGSLGGTVPTVGGTVDNNSNNSQINILLASGLIGAASCALQAGVLGVSTSGAAGGTAGAGVVTGAVTAPTFGTSPGPNLVKDTGTQVILAASYGVQTSQAVKEASKDNVTFVSCITNVLAKAALQQITASVVNWINSGFNGQPSFITNYEQFFTNVADLAAGQFIQGAGLSFLCSPFKLQIKVAIAQSYANRNAAQSCSLTGVIKNINSFMNGNFAQGGWPGMLSFTTMPTNNPYGAYAYAQVGLQSAQSNALSNARNNISPTGFLAVQKATCNGGVTSYSPTIVAGVNQQAAMAGGSGTNGNCKTSITTPGTVIEGTLQATLKSPIDQLGLANSIDQILNALTNQLITKTLQNGLSNLSGTTGLQNTAQTPAEQAAQAQAQNILISLQAQGTYAQQYGNILQGSISDIQTTQNQLNNLSNCWITAASSTSVTSSQAPTASANATAAQSTLISLNPRIEAYNDSITSVNAQIALIQELQSEALSVSSVANVTALNSHYTSAQAARPFIGQADITTAQQNRTTLQSQLASINSSTQTGLQQCRAFAN